MIFAVRELLEAAAQAPSGGNLQPWRVYALAGEPLAVTPESARRNVALMEAALRAAELGQPLNLQV